MKRRRMMTTVLGLLAIGLASGGTATASPALDHGARDHGGGRNGYSFAVIGDTPYGAQQIENFPKQVDQINADPAVRMVTHVGDIKDGSSTCTDAYFASVRTEFDRFADPLVYTPGDNEWTDCHRTNNGSYDPLERLAKVREDFFPRPGRTLGQRPMKVTSQADQGVVENVRWKQSGVNFAAVHIVGSNNGLKPWTDRTAATPEQLAEVLERTVSGVQEIHDTFREARQSRSRAVVIFTQADMFDPTVDQPQLADYFGFQPYVKALGAESNNFDGEVYLFNGDSHVFHTDQPLAAGSSWLTFYDVAQPTSNLQRITVQGSTEANEYLRVTLNGRKGAPVITTERVPFE